MKKNHVVFISAEFSVFLLGSPLDTTLMLSKAGSSQCQMLSSLALGSLFKATSDHSLWLSPSGLGASGMGLTALQGWLFISTGLRGRSTNAPKAQLDPPPPASPCSPAVSLSLATDPSVSEKASGGIRRIGPLDLLWEVPFTLKGIVGVFHCVCAT